MARRDRKGYSYKGRAERLDGAVLMKQIYDDLGIVKSMDYHNNPWDENVAHNWNSHEGMGNIKRKIKDGTGEWDTSYSDYRNSIKDPERRKAWEERAEKVFQHYLDNEKKGGEEALWPESYKSTLPPAPDSDEDLGGSTYGKDHWNME